MSTEHVLEYTRFAQIALSMAVLSVMIARRTTLIFPALVGFIGITVVEDLVQLPLLFFRQRMGIPIKTAYQAYFISGWSSQLLVLCLLVLIIYGLFSEAMRPFPGLQRIGKIIFRWVGAVSFLVAIALSIGPDLFARGSSLVGIYTELAPRFQQGINVLILCLLIFVCFAIRPLGLTFRSHIFGVVLGLGIYSTVQLVQSAWLATMGRASLYSGVYVLGSVGGCLALCIWGIYFGLPEPKRRMILLPTTSPFFLWNRISEILGDEPGQVAVAGFHPDMLAPAEIQMLTAATSREAASAREREQAGLHAVGNLDTRYAAAAGSSRRSIALTR